VKRVTIVDFDDRFVRCIEHGDGLGGPVHEVPNDGEHVIQDGEVAKLAIGELEAEEGEYLLTVLDHRAVERGVRQVGDNVELVDPTGRTRPIVREGSALGLAGQREIAWAQKLRYLAIDPEAPVPGHWEIEGGLNDWLKVRRAEADRLAKEKKARQAASEAASLRAKPVEELRRVFINPYTFVPFAEEVRREPPAGHGALVASRLAGSLRLTFTTRTPLLIRWPNPDGARRSFPVRLLDDGQRVPIVPGSSLKGALRSLHETMAGGCLRVVDQDFVPVYRDPARARDGSWTLAKVEAADSDGFPTDLRLCDEIVWVEATELHRVVPAASLRTGTTVGLDTTKVVRNAQAARRELQPGGVRAGSDWVVLVTDAKARSAAHPYHCAVGRPRFSTRNVSPAAWETYLRCVEGSDDVRRSQQGSGGPAGDQAVTFRSSLIGYRRTASRALRAGDVVWVRTDGPVRQEATVTAIALSALWRSPGRGPVRERFPASLRPCHDPDDLCVSCRLFGAVDDEGGQRTGEQRGYRGHVRVGEARAVEGARISRPPPLAPLGAPRPGAGQFYLVHDRAAAGNTEHRPAREWGAEAEGPEARRLRGRKYYWHGDPDEQRPAPRHLARPHHTHDMAEQVELVDPGATFQAAISFENLSPYELGSLLAVLDPAAALHDVVPPGYATTPRLAARLGGGKPLGLGSIELRYDDLRVHTAGSRYGDGTVAHPEVRPEELVAGFVDGTPEPVRKTWLDLAAVLDEGHVDPHWIWYPPGDLWPDAEAGQIGKQFDDGFDFWKRTAGQRLKNDAEEMVKLAPPHEPNQFLDIIKGRRP